MRSVAGHMPERWGFLPIKTGTVRKNVSPRKVAAFIVAAQAGIVGTAKNAQSEELMMQSGQAFFDYLDSLRP